MDNIINNKPQLALYGIMAFLVAIILDDFWGNFIATMYGPLFLLFYGIVIILTIILCRKSLRDRDSTADLPPLPIPQHPDTYEIAYLRGEETEVQKVVLFNLIQQDYLEYQSAKFGKSDAKIARTDKQPNNQELAAFSPLEKEVYSWFTSPRKPRDLFQSSYQKGLEIACRPYKDLLKERQLLFNDYRNINRMRNLGIFLIVGLGLHKLFVALARGYTNVGFLLIMGIIAPIILNYVCKPPRLSYRGRQYLEQLQQAFENIKTKITFEPDLKDNLPELALALYGSSALLGTNYDVISNIEWIDFLTTTFSSISSSSSSSGGFSCASSGGSSCSSSSCGGGGCGGCGGA
ncbi:MAG: TIGR04222 domain-containing membrane protein [Spirulinaceae cyanobacterium]